MRRINILSTGAFLLFLLLSCGKRTPEQSAKPTVKIDTVQPAGQQTALQFPGRVKAAQDIKLAFRVAGTIWRVHAEAGTYVHKGQLLAELDPTDYRIQLDATEAEYRRIKAEADRVVALYEEQVATPDAHDKAVYGLRQMTAKYTHAKDQLAYTRLYAPFAGYVQARLFDAHETVAAGMPVLSLVSEGAPEVEINLPAAEYIRRSCFTSYTCTFDVYPQQQYTLEPISIAPKANANQLYTMRLRVRAAEGLAVPSPGLNAMVTIVCADGDTPRLSVPGRALLHEAGQTSVYLYDAETHVVRRCSVVVQRLLADGSCLISAPEVRAGDLVVTSGVRLLKDGEQVEPLLPAAETNVGGLL